MEHVTREFKRENHMILHEQFPSSIPWWFCMVCVWLHTNTLSTLLLICSFHWLQNVCLWYNYMMMMTVVYIQKKWKITTYCIRKKKYSNNHLLIAYITFTYICNKCYNYYTIHVACCFMCQLGHTHTCKWHELVEQNTSNNTLQGVLMLNNYYAHFS